MSPWICGRTRTRTCSGTRKNSRPTTHGRFSFPKAFAHGFQTLTDDVELLYCHSAAFHVDAEGGLNPGDPRLAIDWPWKSAGCPTGMPIIR